MQLIGSASRTVNDHLNFAIDDLNFVFHPLNFTVDYFHFVSDAVSDPQNLGERHPSFFLCQSVQLFERIL